MSEAGESSGDEIRRSPEDVVRISADALAEHAANTVDVITESLVATELMETGSASKSPIQSEPGAQTSTGISDEGSAEFRSENVFGIEGSAGHSEGASEHTGERIIGVEDGTGSGYRAGIKAGLESTASPGYVATGKDSSESKKDAQHVKTRIEEIMSMDFTHLGQTKKPQTLAAHRWRKAYEFVKKRNIILKKSLTSPIGTGATLDGYSLGFLSIQNETRLALFGMIYNEKTEYLLLGVIFSHVTVLAMKAEHNWGNFRASQQALINADIALTTIYTCTRTVDDEPSYPEFFCNNIARNYTTDKYDGDSCPIDQGLRCRVKPPPNYGKTGFDNVGTSFLILIQILSFEGWSLIMNGVRKAADSKATDAYFICIIILGGYFLVNIYITAFSGVFLRVRQEHQMLLRKYRREKAYSFSNAIEMATLLKDVIKKDDEKLSWTQRFRLRTSLLTNKFSKSLSRESSRLRKAVDWRDPGSFMRRISSFALTGIDDFSDVLPDDASGSRRFTFSLSISRGRSFGRSISRKVSVTTLLWQQKVSEKCWILVHSKIFVYAVLILISINTAALASCSVKMSLKHFNAITIMQRALTTVFIVEMAVRFCAGGIYGFADERMNLVDLVVILITLRHILSRDPANEIKVPNLLPVRMLRWFYVKRTKKTKRDGESAPILACILRSVGNLASVYFFLLMIIIIFSVFSMELWGGELETTDTFEKPRTNHDTFLGAALLWFSVSTGESWVNQMWNVMRPEVRNSWVAAPLFVFYYLLTAIVILNLIIATILEETELTDYQKKLIQKRDHLKYLQVRHLHRTSSTRGADWIVGAIENMKSAKRRMTSIKVRSLSLKFPSSISRPHEEDEVRTLSDITAQAASSSEGPRTSTDASHSALDIPGSVSADYQRTRDVSEGLQFPPGPAKTGDSETAADLQDRIRRRRSSASALQFSSGTAAQPTSRRRFSHASDKIYIRSGFTGAGLAEAGDGGNRTFLQSALLAVVDDQQKVEAGIAAVKQVEEVKPKVAPQTSSATSTLKRSGSSGRVSFVLSDFEGVPLVEDHAAPWWMNERSLFLFNPGDEIRVFITKVIETELYRWWQVLWVSCSLVILIETDPLGYFIVKKDKLNPTVDSEKPTTTAIVLQTIDYAVFAVFCLDLIMKSIAYGFLLTREAYMEDPYNIVDLVNLTFHMMYLKTHNFLHEVEYYGKTTLIMMACRPFRYINRFKGLRSLTTSLGRTLPAVFQVLVFTAVMYAIFALIGMQLYADRFRSCTDRTVPGHAECVGLFYNDIGLLAPRTWVNPPYHFDAFGEAMLALFVASTFDNWLNYFLYPAMDMPNRAGLSPQQNLNASQAIFFVVFVCIGGFFILRMFVGVFIDQFGIMSGTKLLTERQKLWRDTNRLIQSMVPMRRPVIPRGWAIRRYCFKIVQHRAFELSVVFVIFCNCVYLAAQSNELEPQDHLLVLVRVFPIPVFSDPVFIMFVILFALEAIMKLLGAELQDWWEDKWNLYELVLVVGSVACLAAARSRSHIPEALGKIFVCLRILRPIRYFHSLKTILTTVFVSLPSMIDIIMLMGIVLIALAQLGVQIFYRLKDGVCIRNGAENNFSTWINSFIILIQVTTLDNWSCLIIDLTITEPACLSSVSVFASDCGFPVVGLVYMLISVCLTTYIFANLFIAQILDTITFGLLSEDAVLTPTNLVSFKKLWAEDDFDPKCTGYIGQHKVKDFLIALGHPLGGRRYGFVRWYARIDYEIFHFRNEKGIGFRPLLETLCLYKIGARGLELPLRIERAKYIHGIFQTGATVRIQAAVRGFLQRRRNKHQKEAEHEKRPSEQVEEPPDIAFAEDPTLARLGIAKPPVGPLTAHGRSSRPPAPPAAPSAPVHGRTSRPPAPPAAPSAPVHGRTSRPPAPPAAPVHGRTSRPPAPPAPPAAPAHDPNGET
ncbi:hypothetical protein Mp_2g23520 [Marchantia polymorpha subsp. ruderalis]|uniref:Ion transport domain-containing protein n=2 Tax=Marchantia polymorpha TaxID=3197 RepID=A0A2R6WP67_MARPO|nr:hypothetical protein MARPO_0069s0001 [Marchantia polymorpha]BBN03443.1 hypothetical protein Mp_2g23520 [Marchantia polymorpha subsp. ruderalis]|eukprot:PTQ35648.1 hypothetical protein MARPO_0069s0001 [Marchantia polymorpha]